MACGVDVPRVAFAVRTRAHPGPRAGPQAHLDERTECHVPIDLCPARGPRARREVIGDGTTDRSRPRPARGEAAREGVGRQALGRPARRGARARRGELAAARPAGGGGGGRARGAPAAAPPRGPPPAAGPPPRGAPRPPPAPPP